MNERPKQLWTSDITYLPMADGFMYLMTILDFASRKVLALVLSNILTADFFVAALEEALAKFGPPEILNTNQGAVHQCRVDRAAAGRWGGDQHGRQGPLDR